MTVIACEIPPSSIVLSLVVLWIVVSLYNYYWKRTATSIEKPYGKWVVLIVNEHNRFLGSVYEDYLRKTFGYTNICRIQLTDDEVQIQSTSATVSLQCYPYSSLLQQLPIHLGHCYTNGGIAYAVLLLNNDNNQSLEQCIHSYFQFQNSGILLSNQKTSQTSSTKIIPTMNHINHNDVETILNTIVKPSLSSHPISFLQSMLDSLPTTLHYIVAAQPPYHKKQS